MKENNKTYLPYHLNFDNEAKSYIHIQSRIVVDKALEMLEHIDEVHGMIRAIASDCHHMFKHHASIVEYFQRNDSIQMYCAEDNMEAIEINEVDRGENNVEEDKIKSGDLVYCLSGRELGGMQGCTVVEVSPSKKTFILVDHQGRHF